MNIIGIVGGVGPYAGLDLTNKIFDQTLASSDQEHLPVALLSLSEKIGDRTRYLMGETETNPAYAVVEIIEKLEHLGARVVGIPCNTMHAPRIFDVILQQLREIDSKVKVIHMIEEVVKYINNHYPDMQRVGVLSTTGTWKSGIYANLLQKYSYKPILPDQPLQEEIHNAIYNPRYGIKAKSKPVASQARDTLIKGLRYLKKDGAQGIILGCSEISFAMPYDELEELPLFDTNLILARSLISRTHPEKLKSL